MTIQNAIKESELTSEQKILLTNFFYEISWEKKDIKIIEKNNFKDFKKLVNEYAINNFEIREEFITAINFFMESYFNEENFCKHEDVTNSTEFKIKLLKYLQGGGKRREKIAKHFNISERSLSNRISELQSVDNQILGTKIHIEIERGSNNYNSTVHPIFLALNLSEVYGLLLTLENAEDSIYGETLKDIKSDIINQLTEYAKTILQNSDLNIETDTKKEKHFRNESIKTQLLHNMKKGELCLVNLKNKKKLIKGIIIPHSNSNDYIIKTANKEVQFKVGDVIEILDFKTKKKIYY